LVAVVVDRQHQLPLEVILYFHQLHRPVVVRQVGLGLEQLMLEQAAVQVVVEVIQDQVEAQVMQEHPVKEMLVVQTMTAVEQVDPLVAAAVQVQLAQQHLVHKEETVVLDQLVL
jgi:hypothetical protein